MTVVSLEQKLNTQNIFAAIEQLEPEQTEILTRRILQLQASRKVPHLSARDTELLNAIYAKKRPGFQLRFDLLNDKRREESLTPEEYQELLWLIEESETFTLKRLQALTELAQLRSLSLRGLMDQLGIKAMSVV